MAQPDAEGITQVKEAVKQCVTEDEFKDFDEVDFELLWREKYRSAATLKKASREQLTSVKLPGALVDYIKPSQGRRRKEPVARPAVKLDDNAETAYEKAEPLAPKTPANEALAKPMRDLTGPVVLETRLAGLAVAGVVPTGDPALPAPNAIYTGGAAAAAAEVGVCPAWTSRRECDGTYHLNHCKLHDPYFNHALASGDRGKLARLLQQHAGGKWPLTLRQLPASAPTLPFVGREAVLHALGKELTRGYRDITSGERERDASILMTLTDGPGSGKTRLLSEVMQYCDSEDDHNLQNKLKLGEAVHQVVQDDAALGLRLACASFHALPAHNFLQRYLTAGEQELFTLPNLLPILATAVRRRAADKAQLHAAAPESSKRTEQHVLLGILPDELQEVVDQMQQLDVARRVASDFKFVPFLLGAGTRVPQFDKFVPTMYNPIRLFIGPLTADEITGTLASALASHAWADLFDDAGSVREILRRAPTAVVLAELSGVPRLVQHVFQKAAGIRDNAVRVLGGVDSTIELLHLATAGMPLLPDYRLLAGPSLADCLHSSILYLDPAHATVVLRLPKLLLAQLYRMVNARTYEQLDWGTDLDKGEPLERLCWGIVALRCNLLYDMRMNEGTAEVSASEIFFGAFGHPDVVGLRVVLQQHVIMDRDTAGNLFVDSNGVVKYDAVRCLERQPAYDERAGHTIVWCDPAKGEGQTSCMCIDHRLTLPQPGRPKPAMFVQQIKGEEGAELGPQSLQNWHTKARQIFTSLAVDFEIIYVFISRAPLRADGLKYVLSTSDLLVVPRQTLGAYLPVIHDRLAIRSRA
ncbi:g3399 [Coccomyxa elongata]